MSQVVFEGVRKAYGAKVALDGVSLEIADGVTTAIVGPSGSGKTTLLQLVNGLLSPDAGTVRVFGEPVDPRRAIALRRRIGYAVQGTGLFPHLDALENVTLLARLEGWTLAKTEPRARELFDRVGLPQDLARRLPHELSGGEQQRVGLCRAMMLNPPLLLLDEAFGALDAITRAEVHEHFRRLQRAEPRTILMVTHDLRGAKLLADRIAVVRGGRVLQHGPTADVIGSPADEFVRSLFEAQLR